MDYRRFFRRPSEEVAKDLLGRYLTSETSPSLIGRIIETGAYGEGLETPSRGGMLYTPGTVFVMPFRGNYFLNISTGKAKEPSCVLIRQVSLNDSVLDGPGKVGRFFGIEGLDGVEFSIEFQLLGESINPNRIKRQVRGASNNCLGYYSIK